MLPGARFAQQWHGQGYTDMPYMHNYISLLLWPLGLITLTTPLRSLVLFLPPDRGCSGLLILISIALLITARYSPHTATA